ncbi:hypothetical protein C823_003984 [Eubacterium plexicaudatum ASF492]|nr:hypothetical protein C823_003984 [Eubacterium plexicaudatum ASF492]
MDFQYYEMGNRIKIRRKELKLKQAELAESLEIPNNHMSSIETGRQNQVWIFLLEFANILMSRQITSCLGQCMHIMFHKIFLTNCAYVVSRI